MFIFNILYFKPPSLAILAFTESSLMRFQNDKPIGVTLAAKPAYPAITAQNRWVVQPSLWKDIQYATLLWTLCCAYLLVIYQSLHVYHLTSISHFLFHSYSISIFLSSIVLLTFLRLLRFYYLSLSLSTNDQPRLLSLLDLPGPKMLNHISLCGNLFQITRDDYFDQRLQRRDRSHDEQVTWLLLQTMHTVRHLGAISQPKSRLGFYVQENGKMVQP